MKKSLVFVILQYNSPEETINCIESLQKSVEGQYSIIIVDNGSKKLELNKLKLWLKNKKNIDLIELNKNYGFSKGNNIGCFFAIEKYHPDFLYVINNDTLIFQKNLLEIIQDEFRKSDFDVLGPDIIELDGKHKNPFEIKIKNIKNIKRRLLENKIKLLLFKSGLYFIIKLLKKTPKENGAFRKRKENVGLHGSALIFSKKYYNKYPRIFEPEVFLYNEEDYLYLKKIKDHLTFVYNPKIKIIHKHEGSSKKRTLNYKRQYLFRLKNSIKSDIQFLKKI